MSVLLAEPGILNNVQPIDDLGSLAILRRIKIVTMVVVFLNYETER